MYKIILFGFIALFTFSCSENEPLLYTAKPAVYFESFNEEADSMVYSFTTTADVIDSVFITVKLLGNLTEDKHFRLVIDNDQSTAIAGRHYKPLQDTYTYTAGKSTVSIPIYVLYHTDLDIEVVSLSFYLESTEEMDIGYSNRRNGRLLITNQLIKPVYWDYPMALYFDEYSKVKHQIITDIIGHDFPLLLVDAQYWDGETIYGYWMRKGREVAEYIANNEVYNENGELISDWIPF